MNQTRLDRYSGYLTATFGYATATGLSQLLDGSISHDAVSRFLSEREYTPKDLWKQVKRTVREIESADGVLVFDDTVQEKPHMDENDLICWHYDHCQGRDIKGVNLELPVSQQGCIHPCCVWASPQALAFLRAEDPSRKAVQCGDKKRTDAVNG